MVSILLNDFLKIYKRAKRSPNCLKKLKDPKNAFFLFSNPDFFPVKVPLRNYPYMLMLLSECKDKWKKHLCLF